MLAKVSVFDHTVLSLISSAIILMVLGLDLSLCALFSALFISF